MTETIELPETYERYQEFLPEFDIAIDIILNRLATVYEKFIAKDENPHSNHPIRMWLEEYDDELPACSVPLRYYDTLRRIIDDTLNGTGVSYVNEAFLIRVQEECDDYGYEDYENPNEVFVAEVYAVRLLLIDEVQECVEFLDTSELVVIIKAKT